MLLLSFRGATRPTMMLLSIFGATGPRPASLQPFSASFLRCLSALCSAILMFFVALFDGELVIVVLLLPAFDPFSLGKYLGEINFARTYPIAEAAFHALLESQIGCG